jgi:hypothetical protein
MSSFQDVRSLARAGLLIVTAAMAVACGGATSPGTSGSAERVKPGDTCPTSGAAATSVDGCNTCTCESGVWACTEKACPATDGGTAACQVGATRPAGDGCNTCACSASGQWLCTRNACKPAPVCKEGDTRGAGCGACWCQGGGWVCPGVCPEPICAEGQTKYDGCNTCSCSGGQWQCTTIACVDDGGAAVDAGRAPKGCGGWLGDTCTASEYCAYTEGQMCGATDASATCQPRPQGCTENYDPVCGCDQKTYGNACSAAMAGTGVNHAGACN